MIQTPPLPKGAQRSGQRLEAQTSHSNVTKCSEVRR